MTEQYRKAVESFQNGDEFNGDIALWVKNNKPDPNGIKVLAEALRSDSEFVSEQAAYALITIGKKTDALDSAGGNLLRDHGILSALIMNGIGKPSTIRDRILDVCAQSVPSDNLKPFSSILVDNLIKFPDAGILIVIAKAKPAKARDVLDKMLSLPLWSANEAALAAAGALGIEKQEEYLIKKFESAADPDEKIHFASLLGYMGTKKAGKALAQEMRTDLIKEMTNVYIRSVRLDIAKALRLIHPENMSLFEHNINDDEAYDKIEKFCKEQYGVNWSRNRPPFLAVQGFPSMPMEGE